MRASRWQERDETKRITNKSKRISNTLDCKIQTKRNRRSQRKTNERTNIKKSAFRQFHFVSVFFLLHFFRFLYMQTVKPTHKHIRHLLRESTTAKIFRLFLFSLRFLRFAHFSVFFFIVELLECVCACLCRRSKSRPRKNRPIINKTKRDEKLSIDICVRVRATLMSTFSASHVCVSSRDQFLRKNRNVFLFGRFFSIARFPLRT